ncbi:DUF742 domain-containing protein [Streptomyces sp. NPDC059506]|uniref:DUF742 domain-containing protein n=1 Tax=Streptomyces sp. NPDC059506 TaxID=3347751 RepID=UPI0036CBD866
MIRPYTPTGGRTTPSRRSLDLVTLLIADHDRPPEGLSLESDRIVQLCRDGWLSIAEVSAHLNLPGAVTKVLVSTLIDSGHLISRDPVPPARHHDPHLLERILSGLRAY